MCVSACIVPRQRHCALALEPIRARDKLPIVVMGVCDEDYHWYAKCEELVADRIVCQASGVSRLWVWRESIIRVHTLLSFSHTMVDVIYRFPLYYFLNMFVHNFDHQHLKFPVEGQLSLWTCIDVFRHLCQTRCTWVGMKCDDSGLLRTTRIGWSIIHLPLV